MAEIVSLRGDKVEADDGTKGLLTRLKTIVEEIENGGTKPEKWLLIVEAARPDNAAIIASRSYDSGLTLAEAVYMLSGEIYDIHWKARDCVP